MVSDSAQEDVVREFFELFKTPWEFYRADGRYEVLLCAGEEQFDENSRLVLYFGGKTTHFDNEQKVETGCQRKYGRTLLYKGRLFPIYGESITFPGKDHGLLTDEDSAQCVAYLERVGERTYIRIGYDLLREIRTLLTWGQPPANALMPALELHIAFIRDLITGCGIPIVEIPPVPYGYRFIACLTHDVDHPSIRQHKWDHTMLGFVHRAVLGSLRKFIQRRMSIRRLLTNWVAVFKLLLVYMGLAKDFWLEFADRYLELEGGLPSTFFMIPFRNCPGKSLRGSAPLFRAAQYGAQDLANTIRKLISSGCEVGLHGIDAWIDRAKGREELSEIHSLTDASEIGVRMHWLYYDQQSPAILQEAGAAYDSTVGYNEAVGYRAGTTQVYRPLQTSRLFELPLHAMDTALFYPDRLGLSPRQAKTLFGQLMDNATQFGGCLTINWHDRSVVPERLWDTFYRELVFDLKSRGAWFSTGGHAVAWFRKRRSAVFETERTDPLKVTARITSDSGDNLPGLRLRIHNARQSDRIGADAAGGYFDMAVVESADTHILSGISK